MVGGRVRAPPPQPGLWSEVSLREFLKSRGYEHENLVPLIHRVAVRQLNALPSIESDNVNDSDVWDKVDRWTDATLRELENRRDVPEGLASVIGETAFLSTTLISSVDSASSATSKLVLETHDGHRVEAVLMRRKKSTSICVSSQIGCQMGCQFCATGTMGIIGDLTSAEILEQLMWCKLAPWAHQSLPKNVVFMGMGEPLNNWSHVKDAILGLTDSNKFGLSRRSITVSTVGVVPSMLKLNEELPGIPLALSLHAPTQEVRERIVPAARAWPLPQLMAAMDAHILAVRMNENVKFTGMMVEYVLLAGINDSINQAHELADLLHGKPVLVNLIPYNPNITAEMYGFQSPPIETSRAFGKVLIDRGMRARVRIERGDDIAAACGQLALKSQKAQSLNISTCSSTVADIEDTIPAMQSKRKGMVVQTSKNRKPRLKTTSTDDNQALGVQDRQLNRERRRPVSTRYYFVIAAFIAMSSWGAHRLGYDLISALT